MRLVGVRWIAVLRFKGGETQAVVGGVKHPSLPIDDHRPVLGKQAGPRGNKATQGNNANTPVALLALVLDNEGLHSCILMNMVITQRRRLSLVYIITSSRTP